MTAPSSMSPPPELFRELTDLGSLIFVMLTVPGVKISRWPSYYRVYLVVDQLCWAVSHATGYLAKPFSSIDGLPDIERINGANANFSRIDAHFRSCVDLLAQMDRWNMVDHGNPALKDIVYNHFAPKSAWYMTCQEQYCAGRVTPDGRLLVRTALLLDPHPTYRVLDIDEKELAPHQVFDLATGYARTELVTASRQVQARLNEVYRALGDFFVANCPSVKELLHPSSM